MSKPLTKTTEHTVKKGETFDKICKGYGIDDPDEVWNDKDNSKLAKLRKKPELIEPGDVVVINPPVTEDKEWLDALDKLDKPFWDSLVKTLQECRDAAKKIYASHYNQELSVPSKVFDEKTRRHLLGPPITDDNFVVKRLGELLHECESLHAAA